MARLRSRRAPVPLDAKRLEEIALRYVGRYATSKAKLVSYLVRKIRERGWEGDFPPDVEALATRFSDLRYVDDAAYALSKSQSLSSRGYGKRRVEEKLRLAGIGEEEGAAARRHADNEAVDAALRYAMRRKIGPFSTGETDRRQREKAVAAMVRAGHSFGLARVIADMPPGADVDRDDLSERSGLTLSESRFPDTDTSVNEAPW